MKTKTILLSAAAMTACSGPSRSPTHGPNDISFSMYTNNEYQFQIENFTSPMYSVPAGVSDECITYYAFDHFLNEFEHSRVGATDGKAFWWKDVPQISCFGISAVFHPVESTNIRQTSIIFNLQAYSNSDHYLITAKAPDAECQGSLQGASPPLQRLLALGIATTANCALYTSVSTTPGLKMAIGAYAYAMLNELDLSGEHHGFDKLDSYVFDASKSFFKHLRWWKIEQK
jgi:hypothetical protein